MDFILLPDLVARTYNLIAEPPIDIRSIGRSKLRFAGIGPLTQEPQFFSIDPNPSRISFLKAAAKRSATLSFVVFHNIVTLSRALDGLQADGLKASDQALAALTLTRNRPRARANGGRST